MWIVSLFILMGCGTSESASTAQIHSIELGAPKGHPVGEPLTITAVANTIPDQTPGRLMLLGSYGMWIYESTFADGEIAFDIPAEETQQAGWVTAVVKVDGTTERQRFEL
ncbi:MAG: hypothetical protein AAF902_16320, partial [Chloroflexota bacterium]